MSKPLVREDLQSARAEIENESLRETVLHFPETMRTDLFHIDVNAMTSSDRMTEFEIAFAAASSGSGWEVNEDGCGGVRTTWLQEFRAKCRQGEGGIAFMNPVGLKNLKMHSAPRMELPEYFNTAHPPPYIFIYEMFGTPLYSKTKLDEEELKRLRPKAFEAKYTLEAGRLEVATYVHCDGAVLAYPKKTKNFDGKLPMRPGSRFEPIHPLIREEQAASTTEDELQQATQLGPLARPECPAPGTETAPLYDPSNDEPEP